MICNPPVLKMTTIEQSCEICGNRGPMIVRKTGGQRNQMATLKQRTRRQDGGVWLFPGKECPFHVLNLPIIIYRINC